MLLTGGGAAAGMVAMAIFGNQAYDNGRLQWLWLAGAAVSAAASVWIAALQQRVPPRAALAVVDERGRPRLLSEASLAELGVHPNRFDAVRDVARDVGPEAAPYAARDVDEEIVAALSSAVTVVLVHGVRLAGASRSLAHHARRLLPGHRVLVYRPDPDVTVPQLVAHASRWAADAPGAVLWLDALDPAQVAQLDAAVLSTLPSGLRICATAESTLVTGTQVPARVAAALREHATLIRLAPLSETERQVVRDLLAYQSIGPALDEPDPPPLGRLLVALDSMGDDLLTGSEDSRHRQALIRVVTDWQRIGLPGSLDRKVLFDLYGRCWRQLTGAGPAAQVSRSRFRAARAWAERPTDSRPWLIDEVAGGHTRPHPLLGVLADAPGDGWETTDAVWEYAVETLAGAERVRVALGAYDRGDHRHTRELLAGVDDTGLDPADRNTLANVFFTLGVELYLAGDLAGARPWWTRAAGTGHPDIAPAAMANLGELERVAGTTDEARRWFTAAIETRHREYAPKAMFQRANLEQAQGRPADARRWWLRTLDTGHPDYAPMAMVRLGGLASDQGQIDETRRWFRRAAESGHRAAASIAMSDLAVLEREQGNDDEARRWWERTAGTGYPDVAPRAMRNLGNWWKARGNAAQARHWWERAVDTGDAEQAPVCMFNLGVLERDRGDAGAARRWFMAAVGTGHPEQGPKAMISLGGLESDEHDPDEARRWFLRAAETGDPEHAPHALYNLGVLERARRDLLEAEQCWLRAAATEHPEFGAKAMLNLGAVWHQRANVPEARRWWTRAAGTDHAEAAAIAMLNLAVLEGEQGNPGAVRHWLTRAAGGNHPELAARAMLQLSALEVEQGDADEAYRWLVTAAEQSGSTLIAAQAAVILGNLEYGHGRAAEAVRWYERAVASEHRGMANEAAEGLERIRRELAGA
ncbi:hypothetical protein GCM10007977_056110 [Dactylosporangium sucinum]|uniref:Sel1 repeat family protein n=1 Tax=Dactylosporangium sucinum TaxID=1424081 RepID=A0A917X0G2_9ACTN|nr:hypothetical protein GCM10007977_056110 [Dactylosporangium sucinum]